jgi:hypothetical protein
MGTCTLLALAVHLTIESRDAVRLNLRPGGFSTDDTPGSHVVAMVARTRKALDGATGGCRRRRLCGVVRRFGLD